jgi:hypothetical protein
MRTRDFQGAQDYARVWTGCVALELAAMAALEEAAAAACCFAPTKEVKRATKTRTGIKTAKTVAERTIAADRLARRVVTEEQ